VTWLLTIVRSRAVDLLRRRATHPSTPLDDDDDEAADSADEFTDPADRLWRAQAGTRLDAALRELNAAERWVLGLAYFRELPHAAIAQTTGLPLGTVKSLILRSQAKLRSRLAG
jgi:RNA polymerase sigma-70 factor (ECF subfamily)